MCTMQGLRVFRCAVSVVALLVGREIAAQDILAQIPADALGYVTVHNLRSFDAKVEKLSAVAQYNLPRPLVFLNQATGISAGLKLDGDATLVLLGDPANGGGQIEFCIWLPVVDYDAFINSLHANSMGDLAAVAIAGEDLLVARHGDWALIMDPDQRERLKELAAAAPTPTPAAVPSWKDWIQSNDVTAVALAPGVHQLLGLISDQDESRDDDAPFSAINSDNQPNFAAVTPSRGATDILSVIHAEARQWAAAAPDLVQLLQQAPAIGVGLRLDENGNAIASARLSLEKLEVNALRNDNSAAGELPASVYPGGGFAVHAAGHLPPALLTTLASAYVRRTAADMQTQEHTVLNEPALKELESAVEKAANTVQGVELVSQPGADPQPVYTNNFVVVRVAAAETFLDQAREVVRLWNKANREAQGETKLLFDSEDSKIGDRAAIQYSLDVASLEGGPALPEVRQAMEKMFGAGGKLRAWVVNVDDHTVLLGAGVPEQITAAVKTLDEKKTIDWQTPDIGEANALLPAEADWRLFIDAHRYSQWRQREAVAMSGAPVIGGPLVRAFPPSPPIGAAGGVHENELWLEVAGPLATIKAAMPLLVRNRPAVEFRSRIVAPVQPPVPNVPK